MKKILSGILITLFLSVIAFGGGAFLAKLKIAKDNQRKEAKTVSSKISQDIPRDAEENKPVEPAGVEEILSQEKQTGEVGFSFAILGDTQYAKPGESGGLQAAVASLKKINPNLVFAMGDLVGSCDKTVECEGKLNAWKNNLGTLASKTYPAQGNHDRTGKEKADVAWEKVFDYLPTNGPEGFSKFVYSFDFGSSHFVVLASDKPKENDISGKQLDWLEEDLAQNKKDNVFVFFHEPAYPTNSKIGESLDESPAGRNRLWNILKKYEAKAVFSGHEHIQSRRQVEGLYQFGFGNTESFNHLEPKAGAAEYFYIGQAFGLVEVDGKMVTIKTYSAQGNLLNSFILPD